MIQTLTGLPLATVTNAFNEAFSDYIVPLKLTTEMLVAKIQSENIIPENSAGVFDDDKLVAFILTGIDTVDDTIIAYNAGTGVIPAYRGNKLTQKMYNYLLPLLKQNGITRHQLEVITTNIKALKVYEQTGFRVKRRLCCFKGNVLPGNTTGHSIGIDAVTTTKIINPAFFNSQPAYQNSFGSIQRDMGNHIFLSASYNGQPAGFIVYAPSNARVKQFGVDSSFRRKGIGRALFAAVQSQLPGNEISVINIDASDAETIAFIRHIGLKPTVEQFEMVLS